MLITRSKPTNVMMIDRAPNWLVFDSVEQAVPTIMAYILGRRTARTVH